MESLAEDRKRTGAKRRGKAAKRTA
jgi:hypothetical protein